jgi:hypothetical protein
MDLTAYAVMIVDARSMILCLAVIVAIRASLHF